MGKGDIKTKKGKRRIGSSGVSRLKKKAKAVIKVKPKKKAATKSVKKETASKTKTTAKKTSKKTKEADK